MEDEFAFAVGGECICALRGACEDFGLFGIEGYFGELADVHLAELAAVQGVACLYLSFADDAVGFKFLLVSIATKARLAISDERVSASV